MLYLSCTCQSTKQENTPRCFLYHTLLHVLKSVQASSLAYLACCRQEAACSTLTLHAKCFQLWVSKCSPRQCMICCCGTLALEWLDLHRHQQEAELLSHTTALMLHKQQWHSCPFGSRVSLVSCLAPHSPPHPPTKKA